MRIGDKFDSPIISSIKTAFETISIKFEKLTSNTEIEFAIEEVKQQECAIRTEAELASEEVKNAP